MFLYFIASDFSLIHKTYGELERGINFEYFFRRQYRGDIQFRNFDKKNKNPSKFNDFVKVFSRLVNKFAKSSGVSVTRALFELSFYCFDLHLLSRFLALTPSGFLWCCVWDISDGS